MAARGGEGHSRHTSDPKKTCHGWSQRERVPDSSLLERRCDASCVLRSTVFYPLYRFTHTHMHAHTYSRARARFT